MNETLLCRNTSRNTLTEHAWTLHDEDEVNGTVTGLVLLAVILVGLTWNVLVLVTILKEKLYVRPSIVLLMSLVSTDILALLYPAPLLVVTGLAGEFIFGSSDNIRCKVCHTGIFAVLFLLNSFFTMALMSVDRLLYICKPLQYERLAKPRVMVAIVVLVLIVDIIVNVGDVWNNEYTSFYPPLLICVEEFSTASLIIVIVCFALVCVIVLVSNLWFFVIVMRNIKAVYGAQLSYSEKRQSKLDHFVSTSSKVLYQKQARLYLMVLALLLSTMLPWVPLMGAMTAMQQGHEVSRVLIIMGLLLLYSQTVVHPIIETLLIPDVRKPFVQLLTCQWRIKNKEITPNGRMQSHSVKNREVRNSMLILPNLYKVRI